MFTNPWRKWLGRASRNLDRRRGLKCAGLQVEALEDRIVPTILFANELSHQTGLLTGVGLSNVQVQLVIWNGVTSQFKAGAPPSSTIPQQLTATQISAMETALQNLLAGPDLSGLPNPSNGVATYNGATIDTNPLPAKLTLGAVSGQVGALGLPTSANWLYVFVTPSNWANDQSGDNGYNWVPLAVDGSRQQAMVWDIDQENVGPSQADNNWSVDNFTLTASHELAECMTAPNDMGFMAYNDPTQNNPSGKLLSQICDGEQSNYYFRESNGVLVEPHFAGDSSYFVVSDGSSDANLLLAAINPGKQEQLSYNLFVGDLGYANSVQNGEFSISTTTLPGGDTQQELSITANGQTALFDAGTINSIHLFLDPGMANTVTLHGIPAGVTFSVDEFTTSPGTSWALKVIDDSTPVPASGHSVQLTASSLTVDNNSLQFRNGQNDVNSNTVFYPPTLELDVSNSNVTIQGNPDASVSVLASGGNNNILVQQTTAFSSVTINAGKGDTVTLGQNGIIDGIAPSTVLMVNGGSLTVDASKEPDYGVGLTVTATGISFQDSLHTYWSVGYSALNYLTVNDVPTSPSMELTSCAFPVTLSGGAQTNDIYLDSGSDSASYPIIVNPASTCVVDLFPATSASSSASPGVTVDDSSDPANKYPITVLNNQVDYGPTNTPLVTVNYPTTPELTVYGGPHTPSISVESTSLPTSISTNGPATTVNVSKGGSVKGIQGTLDLEPSSANAITVDDSVDTKKRTVALGTFAPTGGGNWGDISGLAPADINYAYSGTGSLSVLTGNAPNTIDVLATGVLTNLVEPGVKGKIDGFGSPNTIAIGNAGSVQGIVGTLNVENPYSFNTITVDDSADSGQTALLSTLGTNPSDSEQNADPWGSISGLSLGNINYEYADTKSVTLMSGIADTINVSGTGTTTNIVGTLLLFGLSGTTVNVGDGGTVQGIMGTLNIDNPLGFNVLTVDDLADSSGTRTATLGTFTNAQDSWGYIGGLAPARINYEYADTSSLSVLTGDAADTIHVLATGVPTSLIDSGPSKVRALPNRITVGNGGSVQAIAATLNIENPDSVNAIVVDDSSDNTGQTATFTTMEPNPGDSEQNADSWGSISGLGMTGAINYEYADTSKVTVDGGKGGNTFAIQSTGCPLMINGGTGGATFNVGSTDNSLDTIQGAATLHGQGGEYLLNVNDQGNAATSTYTMTSTTLVRTGAATIRYNGLTYAQSSIYVNTGSAGGGDVIDVDGTVGSHTFIYINNGGGNGNQINVLGSSPDSFLVCEAGAGSNNLIRFGSISKMPGDLAAHGGSLANIYGGVYALDYNWEDPGSNFGVVIDDSADKVAYPNVSLGNTQLTGFGPALFFYWQNLGLSSYTLYGGSGACTYNISALPAYFSAETLSTGTGTDVVNLSEFDGYSYGLTIHGQGKTAVNVNDQALSDTSSYAMTSGAMTRTVLVAAENGARQTLALTYDGITSLAINGGSGGNTFALQGDPGPLTSINGGNALAGQGNWLDYSPFTTPVTVNLATGSATDIGGGAAGAVTNIQNVYGGSGGSTLIGDAQGNILVGASGADTIMGGSGRSLLIGDGSSGQITGGSSSGGDILIGGTTSYDSDTQANMNALMAILAEWQSGDSYSARFAAINNGTIPGGYSLNYGTTVQNNGSANVLSGAASALALDWFFAGPQDTLINQVAGEHVYNT
jgi:hypothetical protein